MLSRVEILHRVVALVAEQSPLDIHSIHGDHHLARDLCLDSLASIALVMELEDAFDIKLSPDDEQRLNTVNKIVDHVHAVLTRATRGEAQRD